MHSILGRKYIIMKQNILLKRMAALVLCLAMLMTCVTVVSAEDLPTDVPNGDFE